MSNDWKTFEATDTEDRRWLIYSVNERYAALRLKDFGINAIDVRPIDEIEQELFADAVSVAKSHKNFAIYVGQ